MDHTVHAALSGHPEQGILEMPSELDNGTILVCMGGSRSTAKKSRFVTQSPPPRIIYYDQLRGVPRDAKRCSS